jgi:hypothetical protein
VFQIKGLSAPFPMSWPFQGDTDWLRKYLLLLTRFADDYYHGDLVYNFQTGD